MTPLYIRRAPRAPHAPRATSPLLAALLLAPFAPIAPVIAVAPLGAQSIAERVGAARDGEVRLSYASRKGVCGDGKDVVALGRALYVHGSIESYGRWSGAACEPGPVRVTLTVRDRAVTAARVRVGAAPVAAVASTDLGVVPAAGAAEYFLGLASRADGGVAKEGVLAAALADSAHVAPALLRIARDGERPRAVRRRAVQWLGETGGAAVVPDLDALARAADDDRQIREGALVSLANVGGETGIAALLRFVRSGDDAWLQKKAVFWLGQSESVAARGLLRAIVDSATASEELRGAAIFAIGHGSAVTADDVAFLQRSYGRLSSTKLRDQVLMAVAQKHGGSTWLLERARDEREPLAARRQAAFWAGQGGATVPELVALYRGAREPELRKHLLFVLSQRDDRTSTDELLAVARSDADPAMRRQALFWLGQKDDPRVAAMIRDIVTH